MEAVIIVTSAHGIATVTLNKPDKRNAMDAALITQMLSALNKIEQDPHIHLLVLEASGDHFCAGADLAWMQKISHESLENNIADAQLLAKLMYVIYHFSKPVVALVQGAVRGGGIGLVAAADIVIAANNATFIFSEVKLGITPSVISPYVISAIGERMAKYYFLTAKQFDADTALKLGLVHQVVDLASLSSRGLVLLHELIDNSPSAMTEAKSLVHQVKNKPIDSDLMELTSNHLAKTRTSRQAREGMQAFLEKRKPIWS